MATATAKPTTEQNPGTALARGADVCKSIDTVVRAHGLAALGEYGEFERTIVLTEGLRQLRNLISPAFVTAFLMPLQGSRLGFKTDKDSSGGYGVDVVRDCFIEATLRGARFIGNEINIIAGNPYLTKEFFERAVYQLPGLHDLKLGFKPPAFSGDRAIVSCGAKWTLHGEEQELNREIPIRVNKGMGDDAVLGKATRKLLKAVWDRVVGNSLSTPDGDAGDIPPYIDAEAIEPTDGEKKAFGFKAEQPDQAANLREEAAEAEEAATDDGDVTDTDAA